MKLKILYSVLKEIEIDIDNLADVVMLINDRFDRQGVNQESDVPRHLRRNLDIERYLAAMVINEAGEGLQQIIINNYIRIE